MDVQNWQKAKEIFAEALDEPTGNRLKFLRLRCHGDDTLFEEVKSLIEAAAETEPLIEVNAFNLAAKFEANGKNYDLTKFGRYTVLREIGRGGMGAVFLAERNDGEFEQKAALKIIRQSYINPEIERHFRRERQILASLNHPNIAKLLDGGVAETGELFLVMEYIEGQPLIEFAEEYQLNIEERLRLFLKICRAVAFAHQNLIVHRDIKPSNIIVTSNGEPKLLDFGLAKITSDDFDSTQTQTVFRAFTPSYASPEQINGKNITTASDVYSLGVVLYELLTGTRPFNFEGKGIEEILKTVHFTEPVQPSLAENSKFKIQNSKLLKGDLDNIALKALRKEPERRYKSVEAFAEDIERHLNGLPVLARSNTAGYRAAKFFQRNKIIVSATSFVVLALVAGLTIALWQAKIARLERDRAERRFSDVRELSNALLFKITPKIERLEGSLEAREVLVNESLRYLDSLANESQDDLTLQSELASAYEKIGDLQGAPRQPNLSDFSGAAASYEKAQAIRRKLLEINPNDAENRRLLASNHARLSSVHYWTNNLSGAISESEAALLIFSNLIAEQPDQLDWQIENAAAEIDYANIFFFNSQFEMFFPLAGKIIERLETLRKSNPNNQEVQRLLAKIRALLGSGFSWEGKQAEGEAEMEKALEIMERLAVQNPNDNLIRQELLRTYWESAGIYEEIDNNRAFEFLVKALDRSREAVRLDASDGQARENLATTFYRLGAIASNLKKNKQAVEFLANARVILDELQLAEPKNQTYKMHLGRIYARHGWINFNQNNWQKAIEEYNKAAVIFQEVTQLESRNMAAWRYLAGQYINVAEVHSHAIEKGKADSYQKNEALANYQKALDIFLQLEAQNSLAEYDRKSLEKTRSMLQELQN